MATTKYEHLIKPLSVGLTKWDDAKEWIGPGNANRELRLNGPHHLEGLKLNFSWGVHKGLGDWHAGLDPHVHPYDECLLFAGLDTANVNYLGAEVDCCLGEEQETYTFVDPTVIIVPAGLPHGPITTKRMYSPRGFGFLTVELNPVSEITWLGEGVARLSTEQRKSVPECVHFAAPEKVLRNKPIPATGKYAHLVKSLKSGLIIERGKYTPEMEKKIGNAAGKLGPGNTDHLVCMSGKDLEGLNASIFWGFCSRPGIWRRGTGAHIHPTDEVLVCLGIDSDDADYLGAEIEIDMGKEHERHLINKPSAVICPAGTPHLPQVTRWVDRPFAFFAVNLSGEHEVKAFD
ncbi:MAG: hypothetical protein JXA73_16225 [Acidobacteria bacterium]|nr:hypothetical protein [Acidobacteriota bacterium]